MKIEFSQHPRFDYDRESIMFSATADGKRIECVVPQEYLTAPLVQKLDEAPALSLFQQQRSKIEAGLRQRIEKGVFEPDGRVILPPPA